MLGTLAAAETPRPRRGRQRRPRSVATGGRRPGRGAGAVSGPRAVECDDVRADRGRRALRRARPTAPGPPTPNWLCCVVIRPTGCPACRASARRPRRPCWPSTARWRTSWRPRTTRNRSCPRLFGPSCWPPPTTSRRPDRWSLVARDAPVEFSTADDRLPLAAADPARVADLAQRVRRRLVDRAPAESAGRAAGLIPAPSVRVSTMTRRGCGHFVHARARSLATWAGRPRRCPCRPGTSPSPGAWCRRC